MKCILTFALFLSLVPPPATAKSGGLLQTGSVWVSAWEDPDFPIISRSVSTNLFDVHGNLIRTITLSFDESEPDRVSTSTNSLFYDQHGDLTSAVQDFDYDADGVVDSRSMTIYTNLSNTSRRQISFIDNNADGTNDQIDARTYTFDNDNRLIGLVTEYDTDANGVADFRSVESWHYDLVNHQLLYTNISDLYSHGVPVISTITYLLNEDGDPISATWYNYDPLVGHAIFGKANCTYDKFRNLVQQSFGLLFNDPSGIPIWSTVTTDFFYSHRGLAARDFPPETTKQLKAPLETVQF